MSKKDNPQISNTPTPELSTGKTMLVKGWRAFTGLCSNISGSPMTAESMGKKLLWGIGGGLLGHFSGMSLIGSLATAFTGILFNDNIKGMGSSILDLVQGKISPTSKAFLGPLLGGAAGFGVSAFMLHGGFLPSLLTGVGTACVTDHLLGNQQERQEKPEKAMGLTEEKQNIVTEESKQEKSQKALSQNREETLKLEQRPTAQLSTTENLSDKELLSIARNSPNGLDSIRNRFPDIAAYNAFIVRTGQCDQASRESMSRFEGRSHLPEEARTLPAPAPGERAENIVAAENNRIKIGIS